MQCVILAAGNGTRLRPLTDNKPKPLVEVCGKPILDHIVERLPAEVDELIIVIGYCGDQIKDHCGTEFKGRKVQFVEQKEQTGTAHALWLTKDLLHGRFLLITGDDLHGKEDLENLIKHDRGMLVSPTNTPERFGIATKNESGELVSFVEKPEHSESNLASSGIFVLDQSIFDYEPEAPVNGEYYMPEVVVRCSTDHPVMVVQQNEWLTISYPEDVEKVEKILCPEK